MQMVWKKVRIFWFECCISRQLLFDEMWRGGESSGKMV